MAAQRPALRVLIADDSSLTRGILLSMFEQAGDITVVGEAANGRQAVEMCKALRPDIVTMDLDMPVMSGLEAIEEIMHTQAVPILVVSCANDAQSSLQALELGALDVIAKPEYGSTQAAELIRRLRFLAGVSVITRMRLRSAEICAPAAGGAAPAPATRALADMGEAEAPRRVFAVASSTGGPQALARILSLLPADFPAAILVAQHISDGFSQGMADWLDSISKLHVCLAQAGQVVQPGVVYISPSEWHMRLAQKYVIARRECAQSDIYHPSCDALLSSVAEVCGARAVGIALSGMGHDGVAGLRAIKAAGGQTLAQDEASSVVFGMNRAAIEAGAIGRVLGLDEIAAAMLQELGCQGAGVD